MSCLEIQRTERPVIAKGKKANTTTQWNFPTWVISYFSNQKIEYAVRRLFNSLWSALSKNMSSKI